MIIRSIAGDALEHERASALGGIQVIGTPTIVDARAVDDQQDLAAVEAVDEAGVGRAVSGNDGLEGEMGVWGQVGVLRDESRGRLNLGVSRESPGD